MTGKASSGDRHGIPADMDNRPNTLDSAKSPLPSITPVSDLTPAATTTNVNTSFPSDNIPEIPDTPTPPTLSYQSRLTSPPVAVYPYSHDMAISDFPGVSYVVELFLSSKMLENEAYLSVQDGPMERLYVATGYGLIQCGKGMMSYEDPDLFTGIAHTKHGNHIASLHRKKPEILGSRLAGYVVSSVISSGSVQWIKSMTEMERHADLVYAESLCEKALLGIVYSGDWLAFIKEALNMRTTISLYCQLSAYIDDIDALHPNGTDPTIDVHFRSGVLLGVGMCNMSMGWSV